MRCRDISRGWQHKRAVAGSGTQQSAFSPVLAVSRKSRFETPDHHFHLRHDPFEQHYRSVFEKPFRDVSELTIYVTNPTLGREISFLRLFWLVVELAKHLETE